MVGQLNLGILAHVDAGKTTLTERLLFAAGALSEPGSVDKGTTQTDTLALERQRGITIKAAVVSFRAGELNINLIDTPGHPDFIAEVERSLTVLDGAVLVVSAVEGVQAQTVVLMRALTRLRLPALIFVNKIDRVGANDRRVLQAIRDRLAPTAVPMGTTLEAGSRRASFIPYDPGDLLFQGAVLEALAGNDHQLLATTAQDRKEGAGEQIQSRLRALTGQARAYPVFFGSALTGAGVVALTSGISAFLPPAGGCPDGDPSGAVFKVERDRKGQRTAYVRMFSGTIRVRQRVAPEPGRGAKVTAIEVFEAGAARPAASLEAGQIGRIRGLGTVRIGDILGTRAVPERRPLLFGPPVFEAIVVARDRGRKAELHSALAELADQDPLIQLRIDEFGHEPAVSLYGEVQKEVLQQTLAVDFGLEVEFLETTTVCIERPVGTGSAAEVLGKAGNPFLATAGLEVEPGPLRTGIRLRLAVDVVSVPLYVYKTVDAFRDALAGYTRDTLRQGLFGWEVTDCTVTMTRCGYSSPGTTAGDFRKLMPLVLASALEKARTVVCEPVYNFRLEAPASALTAVSRLLAQARAVPREPEMNGQWLVLEGTVPAAHITLVRHGLARLSRGEGVIEIELNGYEPVPGPPPTRPRSDYNPFNRKEYLLHLRHRV